MRSTSAEVHVDIMVPCDKAFSHIVPIDLANIFTGFRPLPAVKGMRDQTGTWDAASQSRTVLLSDGSSAQRPLQRTGFLPILPTPSKVSPASCASSRQKRMANGGLSKARLLNPPPFDGAISSSAEPVGWNHRFPHYPEALARLHGQDFALIKGSSRSVCGLTAGSTRIKMRHVFTGQPVRETN